MVVGTLLNWIMELIPVTYIYIYEGICGIWRHFAECARMAGASALNGTQKWIDFSY